ncbi:MAG: universal stress protein [Rhodospirillales bacterium]|nr:universal stress protein [Rhodospirillales bacterium]
MTYRDVLVHMSRDGRTPARLDAAIGLAERCSGRVTGAYVLPFPSLPTYAGSFEIPDDVLEDVSRKQREWAADAERAFAERMAKTAVSSEWRLLAGEPTQAITKSAHCADITIVGQTDPEDSRSISGLADGVVLSAGGPVLVWPCAGSFGVDPVTVMLAWNGSREARRALADALPFLKRAGKVIVFGIDEGDSKRIEVTDVSAHVARHGVNVESMHTVASFGSDAGGLLLSAVSDVGAELLVMGAYGHRRMRELLLGGATRDILREMTVPVLMSH